MAHKAPPPRSGAVERLLRQDRRIVLSSVALIVLAAGWYTFAGIGMNMSGIEMTRMAGPIGEPMQMGPNPVWTPSYTLLIFLMWWVMMIAMMTPSAAPAVLLFLALKRAGHSDSAASLGIVFLAGYLVTWAVFSAVATGAQWGFEQLGLSDGPMMTIRSREFAAVVLLMAGAYQFSKLKTACLQHCRSPAHFLAQHSRPGLRGAFRLGVVHGAYCLGCCWALMLLLFVGGVMNLYWIVGIALYVGLEKLMPRAAWLVPMTGIALILAGLVVLIGPFPQPN